MGIDQLYVDSDPRDVVFSQWRADAGVCLEKGHDYVAFGPLISDIEHSAVQGARCVRCETLSMRYVPPPEMPLRALPRSGP